MPCSIQKFRISGSGLDSVRPSFIFGWEKNVGLKDVPADRMGPRIRYKESIEAILSEPYDKSKVKPCVESKVFGIGVGEKCRVKIKAYISFFSKFYPFLKMFWLYLIPVYRLAIFKNRIACMKIKFYLARD